VKKGNQDEKLKKKFPCVGEKKSTFKWACWGYHTGNPNQGKANQGYIEKREKH